MANLSQRDRDYIIREVQNELDSISQDDYESVRRTRDSFADWVKNLAYKIGRLISAPFRALFSLIEGFFEGLFS
jgi:hypothetical protein